MKSSLKKFGLKILQGLSFTPWLFKVKQSPSVFWPGCAIMNLGPDLLAKTHAVLKREDANMGLASACCGQPTRFLFPKDVEKRREQIATKLREQGVKKIYTTCANCELELQFLEGVEVVSAWPFLAKHLTKEDLNPVKDSYVLHDPCPISKRRDVQDALRQMLDISGVNVTEPEKSRDKTSCCGNKGMLVIRQPETSAKVRNFRLQSLPENKTITSSCQGCLGAFASEGRDTRHLLEVLFGENKNRGLRERIKFSRNINDR